MVRAAPSFRPPRCYAKFLLVMASGRPQQENDMVDRVDPAAWHAAGTPAWAVSLPCPMCCSWPWHTACWSPAHPPALFQIMALSYAVTAPLVLPAAAGFFFTAWVRAGRGREGAGSSCRARPTADDAGVAGRGRAGQAHCVAQRTAQKRCRPPCRARLTLRLAALATAGPTDRVAIPLPVFL